MSLSSLKFLWWAPKDVCNARERIIKLQGQFRVILGHWFWYQSKAHMRFPISDQWQPWSYLAPFRRHGGLLVEKSSKLPIFTHPSLINHPRSEWPFSNFGINQIFPETRMFGLSEGEEIMTLDFFVLIQFRSVTDGRTDNGTLLLWLYQLSA